MTTTEPKQFAVTERDSVVTVQLHEKDLETLIHLLQLTDLTYKKVAENALKLEDIDTETLFNARSKLCAAFAARLNTYLDFAEPKSKERH